MNKSQGNVPFSWENTPGVRKDGQDQHQAGEVKMKAAHNSSSTKEGRREISLPLPRPPYENSNKATWHHDIGLPLPPCTFQPSLRSSSSRRSKDDDPFLMAIKECTKSNKKGTLMRKSSFLGSCKYSCSVRDDSIVRVSHDVPMSNSHGKRFQGVNN